MIQLSEAEERAVIDQAYHSTVRLMDRTDLTEGGSGVAIQIAARYFIATAAHLCPRGHQIDVLFPEPLGACVNRFVAEHRDENTDTAALELDPKEVQVISDCFVSEARILCGLTQTRDWPVLVVGYPSEFIKRVHREFFSPNTIMDEYRAGAFTFDSVTLLSSEWPTSAVRRPPMPGRDLFIDYDPLEELTAYHPHNAASRVSRLPPRMDGTSGGGIWLKYASTSRLWAPSVRLVGLQVDWMPRQGWLRGSVIDCWLDLFEARYPDLAVEIARIRRCSIGFVTEIKDVHAEPRTK